MTTTKRFLVAGRRAAAGNYDRLAYAIARWELLGTAPAWGSAINTSPWVSGGTGSSSSNGTITSQDGLTSVGRRSFNPEAHRRVDFSSLTAGTNYGMGGWLNTDVAGTISMRLPDQASGSYTAVALEVGWNFLWWEGELAATTFFVLMGTQTTGGHQSDGLARNLAPDRFKFGAMP